MRYRDEAGVRLINSIRINQVQKNQEDRSQKRTGLVSLHGYVYVGGEQAHESIGCDFSRLAIYGDALVKLAEAYRATGDLKSAVGIYKKARAAFYIAACIKPSCQHRVTKIDMIINDFKLN